MSTAAVDRSAEMPRSAAVAPLARRIGDMPTTFTIPSSSGSTIDPAALPPSTWQSRLAALKSRHVADDDPRVAECEAALAYWRCRRVLDRELDALALIPAHRALLAQRLVAAS